MRSVVLYDIVSFPRPGGLHACQCYLPYLQWFIHVWHAEMSKKGAEAPCFLLFIALTPNACH